MMVANQRRKPILSLKNRIERAVTKIGATNAVAVASAILRKRREEMKNTAETISPAARATCISGRLDRNTLGHLSATGDSRSANIRNRNQVISSPGRDFDRYLENKSCTDRKIVEARISKIPRTGWSGWTILFCFLLSDISSKVRIAPARERVSRTDFNGNQQWVKTTPLESGRVVAAMLSGWNRPGTSYRYLSYEG